ncbi:hypothetical protein CMO91_05690 [Candidatus Woesearchaeota archaeon]|jgi:1-acyl-sn-glycerol-3-phosphate acyltransferase|nr:hypothetical protein [Candidatus Woesearchaeota archaeon]|tara:strand:+ start:459 stop:1022 length:564 start_codon:yes stop_codon:yes gene_type:complete
MIATLTFLALKPFLTRVEGVGSLPRKCILVVNHASYIDGPLLGSVIAASHPVPRFIIWRHFFKVWAAPFLRLYRQIPTKGSIEKARKLLQKNTIIGIFPEGRRTHDGKLLPTTHTGLGVLHLLTKAPLVPVAIKGTFQWWPYDKRLPNFTKSLSIKIGKPRTFDKKLTKKNCLAIQAEIMKDIQKML